MTTRRRAVFLVEMLTVLLLVSVGGTLMAVGLTSVLRSQRRVAEAGNQYAVLNDFLRCLSRDVRAAETAELLNGDGEDLPQVLLIGVPPKRVSYEFYERYVERTGYEGDRVRGKRWNPMSAVTKVTEGRSGAGGTIVSVTVSWTRADARDLKPNRRFDTAIRCAGELRDDED